MPQQRIEKIPKIVPYVISEIETIRTETRIFKTSDRLWRRGLRSKLKPNR